MSVSQIAWILATSLILGLVLAMVYKYKTLHTKEFVVTLTLMPALIAIIILLVNGNLGTSVAVAGAFSLIRFRSAAGSSKELLAVFLATAIGLATGMGYLLLAVAFTPRPVPPDFPAGAVFLWQTQLQVPLLDSDRSKGI